MDMVDGWTPVRQHSSPSALEVVIGVDNSSRDVKGVPNWNAEGWDVYDILLHKLEKDKHAVVLYKGTVKVGELVPLAPCAPCPSIFLFQFDILFQIIVAVSEVLDGMAEAQREVDMK